MAKRHKTSRLFYRGVLPVLLLAVMAATGFAGWQWLADVTCQQIEIAGAQHAEHDELLTLAQVDTGMVLFDLDPLLLSDRLQRHPWVREAEILRLPTGTLAIRITERDPVALVIGPQGELSHYLDRAGFQMPLTREAVYDVPLLHGLRAAYHPVQGLADPLVLSLLDALATAPAEADALISELELEGGEAWVRTPPAGDRGSIRVRLGRDQFAQKLGRLHAFWHQGVLTQPQQVFSLIDLRFDSQIVTRP